MIQSMTAYGREQNEFWVCEMRSINHRFLEINCYLPDFIRFLEMNIREQIKQKIKRGKIDVSLKSLTTINQNKNLMVNQPLVKKLDELIGQISEHLNKSSKVNPLDILKYPGVLKDVEQDTEMLKPIISQLIEDALTILVQSRTREGDQIKHFLLEKVKEIQQLVNQIQSYLPNAVNEQAILIRQRFEEAKIELDPNRLEQEMLMFAQKIDISEEVDRLQMHLNEVSRVMKNGGVAGRRLDFLLQELNREANTLGSKSLNKMIIHHAVDMKVLIEQIREQVQNIE